MTDVTKVLMEMELDEIVDRGRLIASALRMARISGVSWDSIGEMLHMTPAAARRRYGFVDHGLGLEDDASIGPAELVVDNQAPRRAEPVNPPRQLGQLSDDEIISLAGTMRGDLRSQPKGSSVRKLREEIIIVLYNRDFPQTRIAEIFDLSSQRISQIVNGYYNRIQQEWEKLRDSVR